MDTRKVLLVDPDETPDERMDSGVSYLIAQLQVRAQIAREKMEKAVDELIAYVNGEGGEEAKERLRQISDFPLPAE